MMVEKVSGISRQQLQPEVRQQQKTGDFGELLKQECQAQLGNDVAFSKHAKTRAEERGIDITPDLMDQLRGGMIRAQAKGATNILAMDGSNAFIINVPNAKVITTITQEELKENIFTNIDGAVFL